MVRIRLALKRLLRAALGRSTSRRRADRGAELGGHARERPRPRVPLFPKGLGESDFAERVDELLRERS
jgi:hypothetical protein